MTLTEPIFANLLTLLAATEMLTTTGQPNGTAAFVTALRKLPPPGNIAPAIQPALYILEGEETETDRDMQGLPVYEIAAAVVIFFRTQGEEVPSTLMNNLRDAFLYQMQQKTVLPDGQTIFPLMLGEKQTLGGTCYEARVKGRVLKNEGLQNGQGALVFPISILTGV